MSNVADQPLNAMTTNPGPPIVEFLKDLFSDDELNELAFAYFPAVYDEFTVGMLKGHKARLLVDYVRHRERLSDLLAALERERPGPYPKRLGKAVFVPPEIDAMPERDPRQIFVSHAHQDAEFARRLAEALRSHGWRVWIAPDSIRPGEKWVEAINRGLQESGVFVLVLTELAAVSRWVQSETNLAIQWEHQGRLRFIPVRLTETDVREAPALWQIYQLVPFHSGFDRGLEALLTELDPERMVVIRGKYRLLQEAAAGGEWAAARDIGSELEAEYPGYLDVRERLAEAATALTRAQNREGQLAELYAELQAAVRAREWQHALDLGERMLRLSPAHRDVERLLAEAGEGLQAQRREARLQPETPPPARQDRQQAPVAPVREGGTIKSVPRWAWAVTGLVVVILVIWGLSRPGGGDEVEAVAEAETSGEEAGGGGSVESAATATMTPAAGEAATRSADEMTMLWVPPGTFSMSEWEAAHEVTLDGFWIDRTEVTNAQYRLCVADAECLPSEYSDDSDLNGANYPVVGVSWLDAQAYCDWAGARLPTEAEWEYAARGPQANVYPWGDTFDDRLLNFCDASCEFEWKDTGYNDGFARTAPVGFYPEGKSWIGALDMAGNVWEWVNDWYSSDYYDSSAARNPEGPETGDNRLIRGGSWGAGSDAARAAYRDNSNPTGSSSFIGFRCAQN